MFDFTEARAPLKYFRVRNFERFQHYNDRRPPWIKLYRDILDDPRFFRLSEVERYILIGIFILASQHDNKLPLDQSWLKVKLLTKKSVPVEFLIDSEWLEWWEPTASVVPEQPASTDASTQQAERYPSRAGGETETEVQSSEQHAPLANGAEDPYSPDFEIFWTTYPRKVGKGDAWKAWKKLRPSRQLQDKIRVAVAKARESLDWTKENGKYIPNPSTWINQRRWDDEAPSAHSRPDQPVPVC